MFRPRTNAHRLMSIDANAAPASGRSPALQPHRRSDHRPRPNGDWRFCRGRVAQHAHGFSLIELLVTLLVVAILGAMAQAAYTAQVRKGNRAAAEAFMMDTATREQQYFLDVRSYADIPTLGVAIPQQVGTAYVVTATPIAGPPPGFTLTAVPQGNQASDSCGTLTITDAGAKSPANCW